VPAGSCLLTNNAIAALPMYPTTKYEKHKNK